MKEVTLSRSAWHVKFFTWATGSAPKWNNLCPYFWSLVSLLIISPLLLLWKIVKLIFKGLVLIVKAVAKTIPEKPEKEYVYKEPTPQSIKRLQIFGSIQKWIGRIFITLYFSLIVIAIGMGLYQLFMTKGALISLTYIFAFIGVIAVSVAILWGLFSYFESDTHEMVKSMFIAKKQKYCPHINWKE